MIPKLIVTGILALLAIEYMNCDCPPPNTPPANGPPPNGPPPNSPPPNGPPPDGPPPNGPPPNGPPPNGPPTNGPPPNGPPPNGPPTNGPPPNGPPPNGPPPNGPPTNGPPPNGPPTNGPPTNGPPTNGPSPANGSPPTISSNSYPNPKRDESVEDTYGCTKIKDPYRWMENMDCPEIKKFIEEEMAITKPYLEKSPFRAELETRYKELYDYEKRTGPFQKGKKFFYFKNTGLQNQDVLYVQDSLPDKEDKGKVLLDPNTLSQDGTVAIDQGSISFSDDGEIMAYATSVAGSDWETVQFKTVGKADMYKEKLEKIKFSSFPWTKDNKGIFYSAYLDQKTKGDGTDNTSNKNNKIYYHLLGNDQSKDVMVAEYPENPDYFLDSNVSDCGKYLIVRIDEGIENNMVFVAEIGEVGCEIKGKLQLKPLFPKMEAEYDFIGNNEKLFIFRTNKGADNSKIITVDITNPSSVKDLVPEQKDNLEWAAAAHEKYLILCYTHEVKSVLQVHDINTGKMLKKFDLEIGTVKGGTFFGDRKSPHIFFNLECFLTPGITYHCDLSNPSFDLKVIHEIKLKNFCREEYEVNQEYCQSKDGTKIPMYIIHKKGLKKDGNNLGFMWAYGEMNSSLLPYFTVNRLVIIGNFDGVHVAANLRGGGEFGQKWHKAGYLDKKQNHFDDFYAAAEYLIAQKYTNNKLLAIDGPGLTMAVGAEQRPELFGVAVGEHGVYDMLRYDNFTIGHAWVTEYGKPSDPKAFQHIIKYSPLHNVKIPCEADKQYPPIMLSTSDHDDRVPPLHSYKFIAELQFQAKSHPNQKNPFILRVEKDSGIGFGKPTDKEIAELVDLMSFIVINTGVKFHPCGKGGQNSGGP